MILQLNSENINKLNLLKQYTDLQANCNELWSIKDDLSIFEAYLQQEIRKLVWMIEEASSEQILEEIKKLNDILND